MQSNIWLSYDLGVRGDYEGMYVLLDSLGAKECGDSTSFCVFKYNKDLLAELKATVKKHLSLNARARVYVIYPTGSGKYKGKFLFGRRKDPHGPVIPVKVPMRKMKMNDIILVDTGFWIALLDPRDALLTMNPEDFRDVCQSMGVTIL